MTSIATSSVSAIQALMNSLPENTSTSDRELILSAYQFAEKAHEGQTRASGEPYISHCVAVATILANMQVPTSAILAGLLHDTVEDTTVTMADIAAAFGPEVAMMVDGVTKLTNLPRVSKAEDSLKPTDLQDDSDESAEQDPTRKSRMRELHNETLRKTFIAMGEDIRVVLIKLADRLHNMRTLGFLPESKRKSIAQETLDIFAPLANRLGLWNIKWELEDLSFRYVNPQKYKEIAENLTEKRTDREKEIKEIINVLSGLLRDANIEANITGRPKHIYSIYKKMVEKGKPFELVRDLRAVRLIVNDIPSCYSALGVIHTRWRPLPHEFDDYIAAPKDNFYQSLHTAVIYDDGKPLEVQIRTPEMNENAEYGIAAHWKYKEHGKINEHYEQRINWIRKLMEWRQDVVDAQEFVDGLKSDVFEDRVYVFTPRGDIIDLPLGSTPIDFAYHVHTEIGHRCRGAKINGKLVTLDYRLKTGDQVQILTAKQGGPSRDWLNTSLGMVKSQRARSKIRQWFKVQDYEQNLVQGKETLEKELRRLGVADLNIEQLGLSQDYKTIEDIYVAIGCGDLSMGRIVNRLSELNREKDPLLVSKPLADSEKDKDAVTVLGLKGILTNIAHCCNPAPGDDIVGYITIGRGVTIHRKDCPNVLRVSETDRLIKVSWGQPQKTYPVSIEIKAYDRQGLMGDISNVVNDEDINLIEVSLKVNHNHSIIKLVLEVNDINQLSRLLSRIENLPNVLEAHRVRPG